MLDHDIEIILNKIKFLSTQLQNADDEIYELNKQYNNTKNTLKNSYKKCIENDDKIILLNEIIKANENYIHIQVKNLKISNQDNTNLNILYKKIQEDNKNLIGINVGYINKIKVLEISLAKSNMSLYDIMMTNKEKETIYIDIDKTSIHPFTPLKI